MTKNNPLLRGVLVCLPGVLALGLVMAAAPPQVSRAAVGCHIVILSDFLRIREEPAAGAQIVGQYQQDERVIVAQFLDAADGNRWAKTTDGWVAMEYESMIFAEVDPDTGAYCENVFRVSQPGQSAAGDSLLLNPSYCEGWVTSGGGLNVREEPDAQANRLGVLRPDTRLRLWARIGKWYRIEYTGQTAYVYAAHVHLADAWTCAFQQTELE
ncbi:MAG: SH3 domain-containing protein [Anaerolineae bacterium]|nr:SH3 domain-containing protein [Anaerolineae bacterium]